MNWEAIGAIAEVLGAVAVLVTLVYLAVQIRQNTRQIGASSSALRLASRDATQQAFSRWRHLVSQPEAADLYLRGCADLGSLSLEDRFRFGIYLQDMLLSFETLHKRIPEELYEREEWEQRQWNPLGDENLNISTIQRIQVLLHRPVDVINGGTGASLEDSVPFGITKVKRY